jgi:biotin transport system substrate-specific component
LKLSPPIPTLADNILPAWNADSRLARLAHDAVLVLAFTGLVIFCAQIIIRLPWTTVPITGQTFAVLVTGAALGPWRGATSLTLYMLIGMVGAPVFAPGLNLEGQTVHFLFPWAGNSDALWEGSAIPLWDLSSGGYILGFIGAAWLAGWLARKGYDRGPWLLAGLLAANIVLYVPGLIWLAVLIGIEWIHPLANQPLGDLIAGGTTLEKTLVGGLYPFVLGDLIKLYLASLTLPAAWALVKRRRGDEYRPNEGIR